MRKILAEYGILKVENGSIEMGQASDWITTGVMKKIPY